MISSDFLVRYGVAALIVGITVISYQAGFLSPDHSAPVDDTFPAYLACPRQLSSALQSAQSRFQQLHECCPTRSFHGCLPSDLQSHFPRLDPDTLLPVNWSNADRACLEIPLCLGQWGRESPGAYEDARQSLGQEIKLLYHLADACAGARTNIRRVKSQGIELQQNPKFVWRKERDESALGTPRAMLVTLQDPRAATLLAWANRMDGSARDLLSAQVVWNYRHRDPRLTTSFTMDLRRPPGTRTWMPSFTSCN